MRSRATVILFVAAALAGCGGSGETKTVTFGAGAAGGPRTTTGPAADASGASGKAGAATGPALAERDGKVDGVPVHLELAQLKRSSGTTALLLRLTTSAEDRAQVGSSFDDGIFQKSTGPDADTLIGADTLTVSTFSTAPTGRSTSSAATRRTSAPATSISATASSAPARP